MDLSGPFYFAWVVPAAILLFIFAALFARFALALPYKTRGLFGLAAVIYVGGALGIEMIGAAQASANGTNNLSYALVTIVEESLEMVGLVTFFYALADYIRSQWGELKLRFDA